MFKHTDGKWTAVSVKIRNLYDSVLKENIPQHLKESSQFNPKGSVEAASLMNGSTPDATESNRTAAAEIEPSDTANASNGIGQESVSPLPDQNNTQINDSKN